MPRYGRIHEVLGWFMVWHPGILESFRGNSNIPNSWARYGACCSEFANTKQNNILGKNAPKKIEIMIPTTLCGWMWSLKWWFFPIQTGNLHQSSQSWLLHNFSTKNLQTPDVFLLVFFTGPHFQKKKTTRNRNKPTQHTVVPPGPNHNKPTQPHHRTGPWEPRVKGKA